MSLIHRSDRTPLLCWFSDHQRLFDFHRWEYISGRVWRCRRCGVDY